MGFGPGARGRMNRDWTQTGMTPTLPLSEGACIMTASMESHCIPFRELSHNAKLFSSFLEDFSRVSSYYAHPPTAAGIEAAAHEVRRDSATRRSDVEILREQNQRFAAGSKLDSA